MSKLGATALEPALSLLTSFWWLLVLLSLLLLFKLPRVKGWAGEKLVATYLRLSLPRNQFTVLNDVTLRASDGSTTQIDHIVVGPTGLYVIETKNMSGWIFGREKDQAWTQQFFRRKYRFQNPLRQNYRHICVIREMLADPGLRITNAVVFVGSAEFKTGKPAGVHSIGNLGRAIASGPPDALTPARASAIAMEIQAARMARGSETNRKHRANLKHRHREPKAPIV